MPRQSKPRKPDKRPADDEVVERLIPVKGWVYNLMTDRAVAQGRTTKYQLSIEIEGLAKKIRDKGIKDDEPGVRKPAGAAA
jgi:hypothetical protein